MVFYLYTLDYPDHEAPNITVEHVAMDPLPPPHLQHKTSMAMEGVKDLSANLGLSEGAATHDPRMMNNVLVYAIAEKYDIPDLKALAKRKFQNLAESKWPHDEFHVVAEAVFSTTPDGDTGLRQVVLDICEEHFREILKDEASRMGFLDNHSIAAVVAIAAVQRIDHLEVGLDDALAKQIAKEQDLSNMKTDADRALAQLSGEFSKASAFARQASGQKEVELSKAKADMQEALNHKDALVSRINALFQNVGDIWECRHCHDGFNCYPECLWTRGGFNMQIRCMNCQTRHVL